MRKLIARGIPIYSFYEGREPAEYFQKVSRDSGGVAREYRMERTQEALADIQNVIVGLLEGERRGVSE